MVFKEGTATIIHLFSQITQLGIAVKRKGEEKIAERLECILQRKKDGGTAGKPDAGLCQKVLESHLKDVVGYK